MDLKGFGLVFMLFGLAGLGMEGTILFNNWEEATTIDYLYPGIALLVTVVGLAIFIFGKSKRYGKSSDESNSLSNNSTEYASKVTCITCGYENLIEKDHCENCGNQLKQ